MLNTEKNTPAMGRLVLAAFRKWCRATGKPTDNRLDVFFEHGQWWAQDLYSGAQWSVCDASCSSGKPEAYGIFDGFAFEQVTRGEEE